MSAYTCGALPVVHLHQRPVDVGRLAQNLATELERRAGTIAPREVERLGHVRGSLAGFVAWSSPGSEEGDTISFEPSDDSAFALSAEATLPALSGREPSSNAPSVLRADLLPLLFRGKVRVSVFGHTRELSDVHVFIVAEQLAELALEALEAHQEERPMMRRVEAGGAICGFRLGERRPGGPLEPSLTLGRVKPRVAGASDSWTFPSLEVGAFARAVVDFGRALTRGLVRRDRSQTHNLRLVEFRAKIRAVAVACREVERDDTLVNKSPESYRAYASSAAQPAGQSDLGRARLRFSPKWTAAVPAIDLRASFQCGESFIAGSLREISCLDRRTGSLLWRRPVTKGVSVLTPSGIARIDEQGQLVLVDLASGDARAVVRMAPRVGAPITGAVVSGPGLPRLLIVSEGKRHLSAIDLDAGAVSWRHAARVPGTFRLRRAGRLIIVASGERAIYALDVVTGEVVWRLCDRMRFTNAATVADDSLFTVAGDGAFVGRGGAKLMHLCPWSGEQRWSAPLPPGARPFGSPLVAGDAVMTTVLDRGATWVVAFDRRTGEHAYSREACRGIAAAMVVDDVIVLNSESGELVALETAKGALRYRHHFADGVEGDRPRRLEPVLRSGALFVPQAAVHVVRPSDGTLLGTVATDLIPDLLRVDERCDVYVAEESGHVAAFGRAAELRLVK